MYKFIMPEYDFEVIIQDTQYYPLYNHIKAILGLDNEKMDKAIRLKPINYCENPIEKFNQYYLEESIYYDSKEKQKEILSLMGKENLFEEICKEDEDF